MATSLPTQIRITPEVRHPHSFRAAPNVPVGDATFFGKDGFSFGDLIDVINPLQHIPGISTVYRHLTGDELSPAARFAGGALLGGPLGFLLALGNTIAESGTGQDLGEHAFAFLTGGTTPKEIEIASVDNSLATTALALPDSLPTTAATLNLPATVVQARVQDADLPPLPDIPRADPANVKAYNQYKRMQLLDKQNSVALKALF